jgi:hypothetical protein
MKAVFYETQSKYNAEEARGRKILKVTKIRERNNQWFPVCGSRTTKVREVVKVQARN